jgi:Flp pilus assembly protein TadG
MGQSLVEFALVVPLLLLLVIGIAEFGRAWMTKNILTGAAREAVRTVVITPYDETTARNRGLALLPPAMAATSFITFGSTLEADGSVTRSATVTYDFPVVLVGFIPGLNTSAISLSSRTTMRRE